MVLIFGGAYQGKLEFASSRFPEAEIVDCFSDNARLPKLEEAVIINGLEKWIRAVLESGRELRPELEKLLDAASGGVIICRDISCGIVPDDPQLRLWREETGRALALISQRADEVYRLFCGIPTRLK